MKNGQFLVILKEYLIEKCSCTYYKISKVRKTQWRISVRGSGGGEGEELPQYETSSTSWNL